MSITGLTEYAAGFSYTDNERGISVTRVYHYDPASTENNGVSLPKPGDVFEFPFTGGDISLLSYMPTGGKNKIICRERTMTPLAGDQRAYQFTVTYNNEPVDTSVFNGPEDNTTAGTKPSDLPMSMEYSGEFMLINPTSDSTWTWQTGGGAVSQPIPKRINTSSLRVVRYVKDIDYNIWTGNVRSILGKVNNNADPFSFGSNGGGVGSWLFIGVSTEYFRNSNDVRWWRAELEFSYRNPDGTNTEGWQKLLKPDGTWDKPMNGSGYLYEEASFDSLWT